MQIDNTSQANLNGTYIFSHDNYKYDPTNPRTYPERLTIRVGGPSRLLLKSHTYELFAQDKWQMRPGFTLSLGLRYDLEVFPLK